MRLIVIRLLGMGIAGFFSLKNRLEAKLSREGSTFGSQDRETRECRYGTLSYFLKDSVIGRSLHKYGEWG